VISRTLVNGEALAHWGLLRQKKKQKKKPTNYFYGIKTLVFTPTCFYLHKPLSGSYRLHFTKVTILTAIYKSLLKYSYHVQSAIKGPVLKYMNKLKRDQNIEK